MTDNPTCVCGHTRSHHQGSLAPHCHFVHWATYERGSGLCDCAEFTSDSTGARNDDHRIRPAEIVELSDI